MKELKFKTGGRRLRIEDLEAMQDGIKGASAFLGASGRNYVVTGCEVTVSRAVRNPNYSSLTGAGGKVWDSIQLYISDGYIWMSGKLRKVTGQSVTIKNLNENVYIVKKDVLTGNNIVYFDGTVDQQFLDYGAEIVVTTEVPETTHLAITPTVNLANQSNPSNMGYKFANFKDSFLSILAVPRSGCQLDDKAKLSFISTVNEQDSIAELGGDKIKFTFDRRDGHPMSTVLEAGGITLYNDDGSTPVMIDMSGISAPGVWTNTIYTDSGNGVNVNELYKVFHALSSNIVQINSNNLRLTFGRDDDGDEQYTEIRPSKIVVQRDDYGTTIDGDKIETNYIRASSIFAGHDENGNDVYLEANELFSKKGGRLADGSSLSIYNLNTAPTRSWIELNPGGITMAKTSRDGRGITAYIGAGEINVANMVASQFIVGSSSEDGKRGITNDIRIGDYTLRVVGGIITAYFSGADPDQEVL